MKIQEYLYTL